MGIAQERTDRPSPPGRGNARDTQDDMPIYGAVQRYLEDPGAPFTTPGHHLAPWLTDPLLSLDLPLATGADDAQLSRDVLGRAEHLAAALWGANLCRFLVSGSTQGNQTLVLSVAQPGVRVAVSRTVHKSLFAGLLLAGLDPVWMHPDVDPLTGLTVGLPVAEVQRALEADVAAVMLVEPAYTGVISDLPAIARLTGEAGVPLLVDQAWGAHLGLHPALPPHALAQGADAMVISAHKTLAAFTQGAMLFTQGERIDRRRLQAAFDLLNTTSPSAAILGSLDRARHIMAHRGQPLLEHALTLARRIRNELSDVDGLTFLDDSVCARHAAARAVDPLKIVLSLAGTGAVGFDVERDLLAEGVRLEMADRDTVVPLLTIGDGDDSVTRLIGALHRSLGRRGGSPRDPAASVVWRAHPEVAISPREAFFAGAQRVPAAEAAGRICAETAAPYPPGIPAIAPGEVLTAAVLDALQAEAAAGTRVAYCGDPTMRTVLVVAET